jgi:multisubunit Na+/H+ antiporter MnhB subunit
VNELDWAGLASNGVWVLGAAVILAAFSFTSYEAQRRGERLRVRLAAPGFRLWLSVGLAFISLGATLLGRRWWERALWAVLCTASAWRLWAAWRARGTGGD